MSLLSLLQFGFCHHQKERDSRWNDIRCEFLLSFLDVTEWHNHNKHPIDDPRAEATGLAAESRLCGLLHMCFMAWEGGAKIPHPRDKGDTYLSYWLRDASGDAKNEVHLALCRALKFSQAQLRTDKDKFAQLFTHWLRRSRGLLTRCSKKIICTSAIAAPLRICTSLSVSHRRFCNLTEAD